MISNLAVRSSDNLKKKLRKVICNLVLLVLNLQKFIKLVFTCFESENTIKLHADTTNILHALKKN